MQSVWRTVWVGGVALRCGDSRFTASPGWGPVKKILQSFLSVGPPHSTLTFIIQLSAHGWAKAPEFQDSVPEERQRRTRPGQALGTFLTPVSSVKPLKTL